MTNFRALIAKSVSRETFSRLEDYASLLIKWNQKINLIGKTTEADLWSRHIADALQLLELIPTSAKTLADMGSGAGLPGLVIACASPELAVTLIEQDQRKAAFLLQATQILGLTHVRIIANAIESVDEKFDVITARALGSLDMLCALAAPQLGVNTLCLFPKGENFATEIEIARVNWSFNLQLHPSKTNDKSCIISLTELFKKDKEGNA